MRATRGRLISRLRRCGRVAGRFRAWVCTSL
ncbi:uncharacterized protein HMPREF1541_08037 [Cyphellophora europaea CBS 101466]|uniref:Uncharacterized protein n=1 Tax=Cyphellophora europaea (strain CBS 101466) TaxID=1220924 RepID=W2RMW9_CYPE1|nr:uncharacterized protein HMPREF1541_08037 [Cyphellophora europaea CBS 101466]ETN37048.1 hypothetical protein HMPREF1541_08037 [Cyphellophora europaea CBS 101466]